MERLPTVPTRAASDHVSSFHFLPAKLKAISSKCVSPRLSRWSHLSNSHLSGFKLCSSSNPVFFSLFFFFLIQHFFPKARFFHRVSQERPPVGRGTRLLCVARPGSVHRQICPGVRGAGLGCPGARYQEVICGKLHHRRRRCLAYL